jgi:hypothetical protein
MIIARTRPRFYLPAIEFVWGCIVLGYIGVNNKGGLIAIRLVLGVVEAGFFVRQAKYTRCAADQPAAWRFTLHVHLV